MYSFLLWPNIVLTSRIFFRHSTLCWQRFFCQFSHSLVTQTMCRTSWRNNSLAALHILRCYIFLTNNLIPWIFFRRKLATLSCFPAHCPYLRCCICLPSAVFKIFFSTPENAGQFEAPLSAPLRTDTQTMLQLHIFRIFSLSFPAHFLRRVSQVERAAE